MQNNLIDRILMTGTDPLQNTRIMVYTVIHMTTAKVGLKPERCLSGKRENRRHIERREGVSKSVQL